MKKLILTLGLMLGLASPVYAGSTPSTTISNPDRVVPFAKKVERELAERGAHVAIVARVGRDPKDLPDGISYTHVAFWVYSEMTAEDGRKFNGYVAHNLYQRPENLDRSDLVTDFPAEFFGDVHELKAGIIIPNREMQARLLKSIDSENYRRLHVPNYSLVANPLSWRYQNCTNFVMAVIMEAIYGSADRKQITANMRAYYQPTPVALSGLETIFGPAFVDGFHTDDHKGPIKTSTFESIGRFLNKYELAETVFEVTE